jgi:hypothetical protein
MAKTERVFDIFFLSFDEPAAEKNWQALSERFPAAKRVHGVQGILNAHRACAEKSVSKFFFVVDGDNLVCPEFDFTVSFTPHTATCYVWRALNPVNGLVYGFGAIKLLDRALLLQKQSMGIDMTTSLGENYSIVNEIASVTHFNTSPFQAWKSAFRECVKLASQSIARSNNMENSIRLEKWLTVSRPEAAFTEWSLRGARCGKEFATVNFNRAEELAKINDYSWLNSYFLELYGLDSSSG